MPCITLVVATLTNGEASRMTSVLFSLEDSDWSVVKEVSVGDDHCWTIEDVQCTTNEVATCIIIL